jgi:hypothetical protein
MNLYTIQSKSASEWVKENVKVYVLYDHTARVEFKAEDRHGDAMEAYLVNRKDGTSYMTDDGLMVQDLEGAGLDMAENGAGWQAVQAAAAKYGVQLTEDRELLVECSEGDFAQKAEALAACMTEVSALAQA